MMGLRVMTPYIILVGVLCHCPAPVGAGQPVSGPGAEPTTETLAAAVKELGLGAGEFVVGSRLNEQQIQRAQANLVADTYPGTIKFSGGEFFVVADQESYLILAVYQRRENVQLDDVKQMIGHLMTRFGEPTTMPHSGLIYWAYGKAGKIGEESFSEAKAVGNLDILATVKFSSSIDLDRPLDDDIEETGAIYYIITSDRLLNLYITDR